MEEIEMEEKAEQLKREMQKASAYACSKNSVFLGFFVLLEKVLMGR